MNFRLALLAIKELGFKPIILNIIYRLGNISGFFRLITPPSSYSHPKNKGLFSTQETTNINQLLQATRPGTIIKRQIIETADEVCRGTVQLYGAIPTRLQFNQKHKSHWSCYESGKMEIGSADVKDIWEPARFSWVFILGQAYHLTHNEKYPAFFWEQVIFFLKANPPNVGPHWMNGQEIALRLIAFIFARQVFHDSLHSTTDKTSQLDTALVAHARRITATLIYARSQQNNHLLSEAAGLYSAGVLVKGNPDAPRWQRTGWVYFIQGLRDQIASDGSYIQQSINYHRLMLQLATWVKTLSNLEGSSILPEDVVDKLVSATHWLDQMMQSDSGHMPNMGSNDGANVMPLGGVDVMDYRPIIRLAKSIFVIPAGKRKGINPTPQQMIAMKDGEQSAFLKAAYFHGRPSQADQLHLDLWWNKWNVALDAGTFRYNHPTPWENSLARTAVHNTITVDDTDQMIRTGRFLWLRQANIHNLEMHRDRSGRLHSISAIQDGYRHLGVLHKRTVESKPADKPGWLIRDDLLPFGNVPPTPVHTIRLAWLLPDWEWELDDLQFHLITPNGTIKIMFTIRNPDNDAFNLEVHRAGTALTTSLKTNPTWGWYSRTYGVKEPALALHLVVKGSIPMQLTTHWRLPK